MNHNTMPRNAALMITSKRNAGGKVETILSPIRMAELMIPLSPPLGAGSLTGSGPCDLGIDPCSLESGGSGNRVGNFEDAVARDAEPQPLRESLVVSGIACALQHLVAPRATAVV